MRKKLFCEEQYADVDSKINPDIIIAEIFMQFGNEYDEQIEDAVRESCLFYEGESYNEEYILKVMEFAEEGALAIFKNTYHNIAEKGEATYIGWKKENGSVEELKIIELGNMSFSDFDDVLLEAIEEKARYKNTDVESVLQDTLRDIISGAPERNIYFVVNANI